MINIIHKATSNRSNLPAATSTALQRTPRLLVEAGNESSISGVVQTVNNASGELIIQAMLAGKDSKVTDNKIQTNVYTSAPTFYFDMVLYEVTKDEEDQEKLIRMSHQAFLNPSKTYVVCVSDNLNPYEEAENERHSAWKMVKQNPVNAGEKLRFTLEEDLLNAEAALESIPGLGQFDSTQQDRWFNDLTQQGESYDFRITTRAGFSKRTIILELRYSTVNGAARLATKLEVSLLETNDSVSKLSDEILPFYLPVRAEPPEKTAILHILPEGDWKLKFVGWVKGLKDRPLTLSPISFPQITPKDYSDEIKYLEAIFEKFNDFAISNPGNIAQWFEEVVSLYKDDCCIIIVDQTGAQLPWEMFKLNGGKYLGAQAAVVRWAEEQYRGKTTMLLLDSTEHIGYVTAYLHSQKPSISTLKNLESAYCGNLSELQYYLKTVKGKFTTGLVYLNHENMVTYGDEQSAIEQFRNYLGQSVKLRFDFVEGDLAQRPIFFVNAPYSGRILWSGQESCGLLKAVLRQVASGYIGALGPVHPELSAWVANKFLEDSVSQGVCPAYFLRNLRALAVKEFQEAMTEPTLRENAQLRLLYLFMYVYYGNPRALLKVVPNQSAFS
jgi:hypothetical protein